MWISGLGVSCVVVLLLLLPGCASLAPPPSQGMNLSYTPRVDAEPAVTGG
ncbi:hypothetical protein [Stigmatella aurantiaca]|nr:hypothetical protein [Stigmatella aurantiaca]